MSYQSNDHTEHLKDSLFHRNDKSNNDLNVG